MEENVYDVIVIGAGASGLMAAWELVQTGKKVAIVEARNRIGGRIHTVKDDSFDIPLELGAEFVHGNLELTKLLLKKAGGDTVDAAGDIWQKEKEGLEKQEDFIEDYKELEQKFKSLKEDITVAQFLKEQLEGSRYEELRKTLRNYVEGYYAADTNKASTMALCQELTSSDDVQYRVINGYAVLIDYLCKAAEQKGCFFYFEQPVQEIRWKNNPAEVITAKQIFRAQKILVTVSLGVLQSDQIRFFPSIPDKIEAAQNLGFGPVIKVALQFQQAFWKQKEITDKKDLTKLSFIFSEESVPTWWTQHPVDAAMLTGWLGGPNAEALQNNSEEQILEKALLSLSHIFSIGVSYLKQELKGWHVINWSKDVFACGGYAYEVVNGSSLRETLKKPLANKIFFAGEALYNGPEIGTVEAALVSGRETAFEIVASFPNK